MLRAVVTAGGRVDGPFEAAIGSPVKALAPFRGGVLLDVVLTALHEVGIASVAVVGDAAVAAHVAGRATVIPASLDGPTNVLRALDAWPDDELLYATSDLPFVDAAALTSFVHASAGYELTIPLAEGDAYEAAYPRAPAHIAVLRGARVANGSVFYIAGSARTAVRTVAGGFFAARKSALALARLLGPALLARFLVRRLEIGHVERRAARVLGIRAAGIRDAAPALCYDVDTLDDYRYACDRYAYDDRYASTRLNA